MTTADTGHEVVPCEENTQRTTGAVKRAAITAGSGESVPADNEAATANEGQVDASRQSAKCDKAKLSREGDEVEVRQKAAEEEPREPDPVVSALQALRRSHLSRDPAALVTCLQTIHAYISNLARNPQESRFQSINCQNIHFRSRVASLDGSVAVLEACGFVPADDRLNVDPGFIRTKGPKLWDALSKVTILLEQAKQCAAEK